MTWGKHRQEVQAGCGCAASYTHNLCLLAYPSFEEMPLILPFLHMLCPCLKIYFLIVQLLPSMKQVDMHMLHMDLA